MSRLPALSLPLVFLLIAAPTAQALELEEFNRVISVAGEGTVEVVPDMARVSVGVVTQASEASEALTQNNAAVAKLLATLKDDFKIAAKDLQTANFSINPRYENVRRNDASAPRIIGYSVSNQVAVKVRDLSILGKLLDAVVRNGANQIAGIGFDVDNQTESVNDARKRAVEDAKARAELFAQAAGVKLGRVISVTEQSIQPISPRMMARGMMMAEAGPVPIESGEQQVRADIQMIFEVVDNEDN